MKQIEARGRIKLEEATLLSSHNRRKSLLNRSHTRMLTISERMGNTHRCSRATEQHVRFP